MAGRSRIPYLSTYTTSIDDTQHVFANISRIIDCDINLSYLIPVEVTRQLSAIQLLVTYTLNMNCVTNNNTPLFGVSDASVKMGNRQHAWVFTTGAKKNILATPRWWFVAQVSSMVIPSIRLQRELNYMVKQQLQSWQNHYYNNIMPSLLLWSFPVIMKEFSEDVRMLLKPNWKTIGVPSWIYTWNTALLPWFLK